MNPVKKKITQTDEGELYIGTVPKIQNYQKGKVYLYQDVKESIDKRHRASIKQLVTFSTISSGESSSAIFDTSSAVKTTAFPDFSFWVISS